MSKEKIITLLLIGFGVLGIVYYLTRKPMAATPGAGGPPANAGGAPIARVAASASAGSQGSIPSIIAQAAALTGQNYGSVAIEAEKAAGLAPTNIPTQDSPLPNTLMGPDIAGAVMALDTGGLDAGTLYG